MRIGTLLLGVAVLGWCVSRAPAAYATTAIQIDEATLLTQASAVVLGSVERIRASEDPETHAIRTDIALRLEEVVRGHAPGSVLVLRELGGQLGERSEWLFGNPEYVVGEEVLVFVERTRRGRWRTASMAMGKYSIRTAASGRRVASRSFGTGTTVIDPITRRVNEAHGDETDLDLLLSRIRDASGGDHLDAPPVEAATNDARLDADGGTAAFTFMNSNAPARWRLPDDGIAVGYTIDATGDVKLGPAASRAAIDSALAAWSTVGTSNLSLVDDGWAQPSAYAGCGGSNRIVFNDPYDEVTDPVGCSGILAVGGYCRSTDTHNVNGVDFNEIVVAKLMFNDGFHNCPGWNSCAVAEVATHELGHTIGIGHSADPDATMYGIAHFDDRCASLRQDDIDAVTFIYPAPAGPTATRTDTRTPSATPTASWTPLPTNTRTPTFTRSSTPSRTATFTPSRTRTPSATATRTDTALPSSTPTETPIPASTNTPTDTATPTATRTPSSSRTASPTATMTNTPLPSTTRTETSTPAPSATPSASPTRTTTRTPSNTRTPSFSPTATSSPLPSATPTESPSPVPSATPSESPTPTATRTPSNTRTPSFSPTATSSPLPSSTPTESSTPAPSSTPSNSPTRTPTRTPSSSRTPSFSPTATSSPPPSATATESPIPSATATVTATRTSTATATATDSRTATATRSQTFTPNPSATRTDTITTTATRTATVTRTPTETRDPSATATLSQTPTATPSRSQTMTPTVTPTRTQPATATPPPSATRTETPEPTETSEPTVTRSRTATRSPTATETDSPTSTPTATRTSSHTRSATRTATPTDAPEATETATATLTRTASRTRTPSATETATRTATTTETAEPTETSAPTVTRSRSATRTATATAPPTSTPTRVASPTPTHTATTTEAAPPSPTASFSPTLTPTEPPPPTFSPTATATVAPTSSSTAPATETPTDSEQSPSGTPEATTTPTLEITPRNPQPSATPTVTTGERNEVVGQIFYYGTTAPVAGVLLSVDGETTASTTSDENGHFAVDNIAAGKRQLFLAKQGDPSGAVEGADAVRILEVLSHLDALDPIEARACDVDGNHRLDRRDAEQILDFTIGARQRFDAAIACGSDWLFYPSPDVAPASPFARATMAPPCPAAVSVDYASGTMRQDFTAVLLGNCRGGWPESTGATLSPVDAGAVTLGAALHTRTGRVRIPIIVNGGTPFSAAQIQIAYDAQQLRPMRLRARHRSRKMLVRFHADDAGTLTIAIASSRPRSSDAPLTLLLDLVPRQPGVSSRPIAPVVTRVQFGG